MQDKSIKLSIAYFHKSADKLIKIDSSNCLDLREIKTFLTSNYFFNFSGRKNSDKCRSFYCNYI